MNKIFEFLQENNGDLSTARLIPGITIIVYAILLYIVVALFGEGTVNIARAIMP